MLYISAQPQVTFPSSHMCDITARLDCHLKERCCVVYLIAHPSWLTFWKIFDLFRRHLLRLDSQRLLYVSLYQTLPTNVQSDTVLMKRDTHRLLHKSFYPPHIVMSALTLHLHHVLLITSRTSVEQQEDGEGNWEGSRFAGMSSSWGFVSNHIWITVLTHLCYHLPHLGH